MNEDYKEWVDMAEYDLASADALLESGQYAHVIFFSQQALEKMLKAVYIFLNGKLAPRIHDLAKLAELIEMPLTHEQELNYKKLTTYYIEGRYPDKKGELTKRLGKSDVDMYLQFCKEEITCLKKSIRK